MAYKRKNFNVTLKEADKLLLEKLAKRHKLPMTEIAGYSIEMCAKYDFLKEGFEARIIEDDERLNLNQYAFLDPDHHLHCPPRCYIEDHWECVWGHVGKPPTIKNIGKSDDTMLNRCRACKDTRNIRELEEENVTLKKLVTEGKAALMPRCRRGAKPNEDLTELYCPENGAWRPIKERKKKTDPQPCEARGTPPYQKCKWLVWENIILKGKLPELEKKK